MTTREKIEALDELRPGRQWVCFNKDKKPISPITLKGVSGSLVEGNTDWVSYEEAVKAWEANSNRLKGVGREFIKSQNITGIDLDDCIDEQGTIAPWAQAEIDRLNSYTEISPSGGGVHIWVHGSIPCAIAPHKPETDGYEMYDSGRYFTVTGKHLPSTPTTIEDRHEEVVQLHSEITARRKPPSATQEQPRKRTTTHETREAAYAQKALDNIYTELSATQKGARNQQLYKAAFRLGTMIGAGWISRSVVEQGLRYAATRCELPEGEAENTLRSGIDGGTKVPHEPLPTNGHNHHSPDNEEFLNSLNGNGPEPRTTNEHKSDLPEVIVGGQLRDTTYWSLKYMAQAEQQAPQIFVQTGRYTLVRVCKDKKNRPVLTPMGASEIKRAMTKSADYIARKITPDGEVVDKNVSPPKEVAEQLLSLPPGDWPFPMLDAIVEIPQMRPDGSILDTPGYDKVTQLYYMPHQDLDIPTIPTHPTKADIDQAVEFIAGFLCDFPWVSDADRANAFGLWLTAVLRQRVRHAPMALISANTQGAGKGLLTDATALLATGQTASSLSQVDSDEEWDKRITALFMSGATFISIDNVDRVLRSPILSKALTMDYHSGRVLGLSKIVSVPQRAIWLANGNNIQLGGDMPRRCYPINMAVQESDPWTREDFKYPKLIKAITEHRGKIIAALLTMARGWLVAGQPAPREKLTKLATFSEWVDLVGGILSHAGIDGFLVNLTEMHQKADIEGKAWTLFLETWLEKLGDKEYYTVKELQDIWKDDSHFADTLPDPIASWFQDDIKTFRNKVGKLLAKKEGRPYGPDNLRIVKGEKSHANVAAFKVARYARDARYKSSLRESENSDSSQADNGENTESDNGMKYTSHTSHTSQNLQDEKGHAKQQRDDRGFFRLCQVEKCTWPNETAHNGLCKTHWQEMREAKTTVPS